MWSDWLSNPGPLIYKSGALPTALRSPASILMRVTALCFFWKTSTIISKLSLMMVVSQYVLLQIQ